MSKAKTWEETVMNKKQIREARFRCRCSEGFDVSDKQATELANYIALHQAKITGDIAFKAGEMEVMRAWQKTDDYQAGRKAGIKEVVEWIEENNSSPDYLNWITIIKSSSDEDTEDWQAKLKEWEK